MTSEKYKEKIIDILMDFVEISASCPDGKEKILPIVADAALSRVEKVCEDALLWAKKAQNPTQKSTKRTE